MDEREQIRTWRINNSEDDCWVGDGPLMPPEEGPIPVVELKPILNLLERIDYEVKIDMQDRPSRAVVSDIEALLQAHGRLK